MTLTRTLRQHYGAYNEIVKVGQFEQKILRSQPFVYLKKNEEGQWQKFPESKKPVGYAHCFYSEQAADDFLKVNSGELKTYPRKPYVNKNWKKKVA